MALNYLQSEFEPGHGVYVIGSQSLKNRIVELGCHLVEVDAAAVLVALDRSFDYAMMKTALRNVLGGARLIGTNPDLIRPIADSFEPGAGAIIHSIAVSSGAIPVFLGKPEPEILRTAIHRLGVSASDAIMLGDKFDTDILAGQRAGVASSAKAPLGGSQCSPASSVAIIVLPSSINGPKSPLRTHSSLFVDPDLPTTDVAGFVRPLHASTTPERIGNTLHTRP